MFERFTRDARMVVKSAETQARGLGSSTIEAEHVLLALASQDPPPASLTEMGLDHDAVLQALDAERDRSLAAVGISANDFELPSPPVTSHPRFAASAKRVLELALRESLVRGDRRIAGGHILLGLLAAEAGTVPRALEIAGIDKVELRDRTTAALDRI